MYNVGILLVEVALQLNPSRFNQVEVRGKRRMIFKINSVIVKPLESVMSGMNTRIVLHEDRVPNIMCDLLEHRGKSLCQKIDIDKAINTAL